MSEFQDLAGKSSKITWQAITFLRQILENYGRCYGKNQLKFGSKPALIVIDVVKAYHDPSSPLYAPERFDKALVSIKNLIEKCRSASIPVIYTSVIFDTPVSGGKWYTEKLPNVL